MLFNFYWALRADYVWMFFYFFIILFLSIGYCSKWGNGKNREEKKTICNFFLFGCTNRLHITRYRSHAIVSIDFMNCTFSIDLEAKNIDSGTTKPQRNYKKQIDLILSLSSIYVFLNMTYTSNFSFFWLHRIELTKTKARN